MLRSGAGQAGRIFRALMIATAVVALSACGIRYGFTGGGLPRHVKTLAIIPFDNETASPELQRELGDLMRRELQNRLGLRDAAEATADAVVRGTIKTYDVDVPTAYSSDPNQALTSRRRLQVVVDIEIVDQTTGKTLWKREGVRGEGEYAERAEAEGRRMALVRIVNDVIEGAQSQW